MLVILSVSNGPVSSVTVRSGTLGAEAVVSITKTLFEGVPKTPPPVGVILDSVIVAFPSAFTPPAVFTVYA